MLSISTVQGLPGWRYLGWLCLTLALLPSSVGAQSFTHKDLKGLVDDLDRTLRSDLVTDEIRLQMELLRDQVLEAASSREPIEEEAIAKVLSEIDARLSYLLWRKSNTDAAYAELEALHLSLQSLLGSELHLAKSDETDGGVSLSAFVRGVKEFLEVIPWWPLLVAIGILYLLRSRGAALRLRSLLRPFSSLKLWGTEFVLNKEEARNLARDVERAIDESAREINREYERQVRVNGIATRFEAAISAIKEKWSFSEGFRFTLHVPDLLFPDTLYQLLDYNPDGYGKGRRWSTRFGTLGRTWRSGRSEWSQGVPTSKEKLIYNYGMTSQEADKTGRGTQSLLSVVLCDREGSPVGIFYADSKKANQLPEPEQELVEGINEICAGNGLTQKVAAVTAKLAEVAPLIHIHS